MGNPLAGYHSVWWPALVIAVLLLAALGSMTVTSWRSLQRLEPVQTHLAHLQQTQLVAVRLQETLVENLRTGEAVEEHRIASLHRSIDELLVLDGYLVPETPNRLHKVLDQFNGLGADPREGLITILEQMRQISSAETLAHDAMVRAAERDTRLEVLIATGLTVAFPLLAFVLLFLMRRRFLLPLHNLSDLMSLLGRQEYRTVPTDDLDPLLQPVFENYNRMAGRLFELEKKHEARQQSLEEEVRAATGTLLRQQQELSRSERLAAVGEVAAGVAHELRNPLAGIQMALSGLRKDLKEPEHGSRLDLVIAELKRVAHLLNDLLSLSRRSSESPVDLDVELLVKELLTLVRYRVPAGLRLAQDVPDGLRCRLPERGLRQALLNLVLNAAQAIGNDQGQITVSARRAGERLRLTVSDDGPGFPADLLVTGVRPFVSFHEGGTGLGLAAVSRFARELGGELRLGQSEPRGAVATLDLPCGGNHG